VVFHQNRRGWVVLVLLNGIVFGIGLVLWLCDPSRFAWNVFSAFGIPAFLGWLLRLRRPRMSVVLSATHLHILDASGSRNTYALDEMQEARWNDVDGAVEVSGQASRVVRLPRRLFWSHASAKNFVNEVNRRLPGEEKGSGVVN
jgi:hypothetical protein